MQGKSELIKTRVLELLSEGKAQQVLGWVRGEFDWERTPAVFETAEEFSEKFVYDEFCGANLCKYLIAACKKEGTTLILAKPCDTYGINMLIKEHRIPREKIYVLGIGCSGKADINKLRGMGLRGITSVEDGEGDELTVHTLRGDSTVKKDEVKLDKCLCDAKRVHVISDEIICDEGNNPDALPRMAEVEKLEAMTPDERFAFWRGELSRCIRCNACRNVCPVCTCEKCVFDNEKSGIASKANTDTFEENMFHIVRAFHVAGRCTDCGECSRVCPQHIPLHLLNRKFIKDIDALYGEYQAGADSETRGPLTAFTEGDAEPGSNLK
ncbi:MAG: 4Fe-4S dicluster domain-containing protein [Eubacteriales bacterium]|nr:4Fe-4S dicluster domain-containing protein [Clostridiales bacterium]MDD7594083.1 4Fe-4S dicluster domain-containing protein [Clostridiales bacterium]MDY4887965.1 4Fe-4S dicluster domain-containing protein [Eubacteriales bacterium]MDY5860042.1 4Fe-4S dicluster domain-containing protein [Eubacteriales bacterium]